ncbi:MAG: M23 family metallopeptidase [Gemmatimonadaceae bacterium]
MRSRTSLLLAVAGLLFHVPSAFAQLNLVAFDVRVPVTPTPVQAEGASHLAYELHVTNMGTKERAITGLEVMTQVGGTTLLKLDSAEIRKASRLLGGTPQSNGATLAAGRQTVLFVWVDLPAGTRPTLLVHRFIVSPPDSATASRRDTLDGYRVPVRTTPAPVLGAPFSGGPWVAGNGPGNTSGHRRTIVPIEGEGRIGQRFATDWILLGADGQAFHGDSTKNANWYGYGTPVTAVADGFVSEVKDGIIENTPLSPTMAVPITLETVGGNHLIVNIGGGLFAFYAHLQPGSLRVKLGDRVKKGQVIGLLGNSGNSTAPHLHFHVTDGSSPLGAEGMPFVFERYERLDRIAGDIESLSGAWKQPGPARHVTREIPLENTVVRFP